MKNGKEGKKQANKNQKNQWGLLACMIAVIVLVIAWISYHNQVAQPMHPVTSTKTYTDPDGYFSIQIPTNWQAKSSYGTEQRNVGTPQEVTNKLQMVNFFSDDTMGINVLIYEVPPTCADVKQSTTTLAGLPATYNSINHAWTLYTTTATFSISYYYPGVGMYHRLRNQYRTPVPQADMDANKNIITPIINSFLPKTLKPLSC